LSIERKKVARLIDHLDRGTIDDAGVAELQFDWRIWARPSQLPPEGAWRVWLLLAGRGFGGSPAVHTSHRPPLQPLSQRNLLSRR